jgi:hypothetical protein
MINTYNKRNDQRFKLRLSRYTNVAFNKLKDIRYGLVDLSYLRKPWEIDESKDDIEIYNDEAVRYSSMLFEYMGIHSLYLIYNNYCGPLDVKEYPEEKRRNSYYFYKEVDVEYSTRIKDVPNYSENRTEKKQIWVSCEMGELLDSLDFINSPESFDGQEPKIVYSYMTDTDFMYFMKESLIEVTRDTRKVMYRKIAKELNSIDYKNEYGIDDYNTDITVSYETCRFQHVAPCDEVKQGLQDIKNEVNQIYDNSTDEIKEKLDKLKDHVKIHEKIIRIIDDEYIKFRDISIESKLFKSIMNICQYFFEYNEELIEYYKHNMTKRDGEYYKNEIQHDEKYINME